MNWVVASDAAVRCEDEELEARAGDLASETFLPADDEMRGALRELAEAGTTSGLVA